MGRTVPFVLIAALFAPSCGEQIGTLFASFGFLCAIGGPISFLTMFGLTLSAARTRMRERRSLRAPKIACAEAAGRIGQRVTIGGRVASAEALRDPITDRAVVHYDIAAGGKKALARHLAVGATRLIYGAVAFTDVEREVRNAPIRIADESGAIAIEFESLVWVHVEPLPEDDPAHDAARRSYLSSKKREDAAWLIHRQVPIDAEVVAIGELRERAVMESDGYRGGATRTEVYLAGPGVLVAGDSLEPVLRALDYREVLWTFAVSAVITSIVTALGWLPFFL